MFGFDEWDMCNKIYDCKVGHTLYKNELDFSDNFNSLSILVLINSKNKELIGLHCFIFM